MVLSSTEYVFPLAPGGGGGTSFNIYTDYDTQLKTNFVPQANTKYFFGTLSALYISDWGEGEDGDEIEMIFMLSSSPVFIISTTNALVPSFQPTPGNVIEIHAKYYAHLSKWVVKFAEQPGANGVSE